MRSTLLSSSFLLIVTTCCWLLVASVGEAGAECCVTQAKLQFLIDGGRCGEVGAKRIHTGCEVTICGNGKPVAGHFCGVGPCNVFGCDCEGGCQHGSFGPSFVARHRRHNIQLMSSEMINGNFIATSGLANVFNFFK